ncbi:MAG TPA: hypothetical protein P5522_11415 [Spirochaetia bacterium]|nr:hypothetical protein [Spirochaetia bacterium]
MKSLQDEFAWAETARLASWLAEQAKAVQYGEISVKIVCHAATRRIEKSVTVKEQIPNEVRTNK